MSTRLNRLLAEASAPSSEEEIKQLAADALKKAKLKSKGDLRVTRSYARGAEVQTDVGSIDGQRVWLEITLSYDRPSDTKISLRQRVFSKSWDVASSPTRIRELSGILKQIT